jgi:magnesium-transporting ATPase (P-type)
MRNTFTSKGLRTIAFAYKDYDWNEYQQMKSQNNDFKTEADREVLEK